MKDLDKNSLLYWFPKIKNLEIPIPKTKIVGLTSQEIQAYHHSEGDCFNLDRLSAEVERTIMSDFSLPVFLRTDQYSNKSFWEKSCYLDSLGNLQRNLMEIISGSAMADFLGLPIETIVVREFIPMDTRFTAFSGNMPVNPERRYFIRDGQVLCHHPYWIEEAIEKGTRRGLPPNWKEIAREINTEAPDEIKLLTGYSQKVAEVMEDFWSVDFCKAQNGQWILIDMALGKQSWHPSECKYSNMPEEPNEKPKRIIKKKKD